MFPMFRSTENAYREGKAKAWVEAPEGTVPEREAWLNGVTAHLRQQRDLADGRRQAALEAVRSRGAQLSACQTLPNAHRAEAEFAAPDRRRSRWIGATTRGSTQTPRRLP